MSEAHRRRIGDVVLKVDNISLRFGGVRAITRSRTSPSSRA